MASLFSMVLPSLSWLNSYWFRFLIILIWFRSKFGFDFEFLFRSWVIVWYEESILFGLIYFSVSTRIRFMEQFCNSYCYCFWFLIYCLIHFELVSVLISDCYIVLVLIQFSVLVYVWFLCCLWFLFQVMFTSFRFLFSIQLLFRFLFQFFIVVSIGFDWIRFCFRAVSFRFHYSISAFQF